ncbi:unnamed protein product [Prunus brigantina]
MSDLIRRRRAMTTTPSSEPPAHPTSAATGPTLMKQDHVLAGPGGSQAPASSASSVVQPVSARRQHQPASTTDTTLTDGTGASGAPPGIHTLPLSQEEHLRAVSVAEDGEGHPSDQQSYQHRIRRAPSGCTDGRVA